MSPLKSGSVTGVPYFDCMLQLEESAKRAVCFSAGERKQLDQASQSKTPIKIAKFNLSKGSVMINDRTQVKLTNPADLSFQFNQSLAKDAFVSLEDLVFLASGQLVNVRAQVKEIETKVLHQAKAGPVDVQNCSFMEQMSIPWLKANATNLSICICIL